MKRNLIYRTLQGVLVVSALACNDAASTSATEPTLAVHDTLSPSSAWYTGWVSSVSVSLATPSLTVGQQTLATPTLRDVSGNVLPGNTVTWKSSNTAVATVSASGVVSAVGSGTALIIASRLWTSGSATVTVGKPATATVATVKVTLASSTVAPGEGSQATAVALDSANVPVAGSTVAWGSTDTLVAKVNATGYVTALKAGTTEIKALSGGRIGGTTLTVRTATVPVASLVITLAVTAPQAGTTTQATVVVRDASNNVLTDRSLSWSSSNAAVATVSSTGLVNAVAGGTAAITATSEGKAAQATVNVTTVVPSGTLTARELSRDGASTAGGAVVTLTGSGFDGTETVTFGSTAAQRVALGSSTTLQVTLPAVSTPGPVTVRVSRAGTTATLPAPFTFWPAPTTVFASHGFEDGTYGPYVTNRANSLTSAVAHRGTKSLYAYSTASGDNRELRFEKEQSDILSPTGRYQRWYIRIPQATLEKTRAGQIKLFLARGASAGSQGYYMLGEGNQFNAGNNEFVVAIDQGVKIQTPWGPTLTPDVWHEIQVWIKRDATTHLGYGRVWLDGKLLNETGGRSDMGYDAAGEIYAAAMGLVYTQGASYPIEMYVDDATVANGYIDPTP